MTTRACFAYRWLTIATTKKRSRIECFFFVRNSDSRRSWANILCITYISPQIYNKVRHWEIPQLNRSRFFLSDPSLVRWSVETWSRAWSFEGMYAFFMFFWFICAINREHVAQQHCAANSSGHNERCANKCIMFDIKSRIAHSAIATITNGNENITM